jgi:hypothetical protein
MASPADRDTTASTLEVVATTEEHIDQTSAQDAAASQGTPVEQMLAEGKGIPTPDEYWMRSKLVDEDLRWYIGEGLLPGALPYHIPDNDYPLVDGDRLVSFESNVRCGMGFPPSDFLGSVCQHFRVELVHLNSNAIAALSVFVILCECWLGVPPDLDLFRYFYRRMD